MLHLGLISTKLAIQASSSLRMATEDENDYKSEVRSREAERDLQPGEDNINVAHMIKINDSQNSVLHLERSPQGLATSCQV